MNHPYCWAICDHNCGDNSGVADANYKSCVDGLVDDVHGFPCNQTNFTDAGVETE